MDASQIHPAPFVLASILSGYPDAYFVNSIGELLADPSLEIPTALRKSLEGLTQDEARVDDLRSEYIEIFDKSKSLNPLYETEYGRARAMFKANELSDIAGFYRAFGFDLDQEACREMVDHVSVETEFYSLMLMKYLFLREEGNSEGSEIVRDGMKKFLESHLGRFISAILERDGIQNSVFYSVAFQWINDIISAECQRVGAHPESVSWFDSQAEKEIMCCGGEAPVNP